MPRPFTYLAVLLFLTGLATAAVYPGELWPTKTPDEAGLDAEKLKAFSDYAGGFGCVVRHGYMVYTWGDVSRRMDAASAAKPVYAHFLFKAVEEGTIPSLDQPVSEWEPRLKKINANLDHKDARITWRPRWLALATFLATLILLFWVSRRVRADAPDHPD